MRPESATIVTHSLRCAAANSVGVRCPLHERRHSESNCELSAGVSSVECCATLRRHRAIPSCARVGGTTVVVVCDALPRVRVLVRVVVVRLVVVVFVVVVFVVVVFVAALVVVVEAAAVVVPSVCVTAEEVLDVDDELDPPPPHPATAPARSAHRASARMRTTPGSLARRRAGDEGGWGSPEAPPPVPVIDHR